ncbi:hypothetical protein SAMN05421594_3335 [Chryseobacterium oleae]|uniref:Uncharacterized protein n=1 Tax=Chryseobacterium oleae TaxID=491207 RepID=A0A1I5A504_CHROL|nr:hypothetical protein [Chryseobacterium oleae]SFN57651.1 hypothetical protein SAMN05421594_3335 [Chryseobacterium oleae]
MKRSYFIFYGSAVAYCISMLAALQIGSLSTISSTVQQSTASSCYSHKTDCFETPAESLGKDKSVSSAIEPCIPAVSNISPEMDADREQQKNKMSFKNAYHMKIGSGESIRPALIHHDSLKKILSFMTSDKLCTSQSLDFLSADMETELYGETVRYPAGDSKSLGGFDSIIEFPDKLS